MKLHRMLADARAQKGISLRELAEQTGLPHATIGQIESGHNREPSFRKVVKIARALGVKLYNLARTID